MEQQKTIHRKVLTDFNTIEEAKKYVRDHIEQGVLCPCCGQYCKLYKRKITSAMAWGLAMIYKRCKSTGVKVLHIENFFKSQDCPSSIRGDITKLRHWDFLVRRKDLGAGIYELTDFGEQFVRNEIHVPRSVSIYNNKVYRWDKKHTTMRMSLKDKFDIDELLKNEVRKESPTRSPHYSQQDIFE